MRTLTTNTTKIPFFFPLEWDPADLSALSLQIADTAGNTLVDPAITVDLYTPTELSEDTNAYTDTLYLDADAEDLAPGDMLLVSGVNGHETHVVKGYDASEQIVLLETVTERAFEETAGVYRLNATAEVDFSDMDVFPPGIQLLLTWVPTGTGSPLTQLREIEATAQIEVASFLRDFEAVYPRAYKALRTPADRLGVILRNAQERLRMQLLSRGLDVARVRDQRLLTPPLMALVALTWTVNGDEELMDERKTLNEEYSALFDQLCALPVWVDSDGDDIDDDGETQDHPAFFERAW